MRIKLTFMVENKADELNPHLPHVGQQQAVHQLLTDYRGRNSGITVYSTPKEQNLLNLGNIYMGPLVQIEVIA